MGSPRRLDVSTPVPVVLAVCFGLILGGCGPWGPLPGGALGGELASPPRDWAELGAYGTLQLETRPEDPYSVSVWGVGSGRFFYVGVRPGSQWLEHVRRDPRVRLQLRGKLYELLARRSTDPAERVLYLREMKARYDWEPSPRDVASAWILRLEPR